MSGPNTAAQFFWRDTTSLMDANAPVSAFRTYALRESVQHVVDMTPQHRINWSGVSANDQAYLYLNSAGAERYYSAVFPHTWLNPNWPCGLDIQICGQTSSGTLNVEARIVPHWPGAGVLDVVEDPYWEDTGSTASASSVELISSIYYPGTTPPRRSGSHRFTIFEGGVAKSVNINLSRIDIKLTRTGGDSSATSGLTRVSVREFC